VKEPYRGGASASVAGEILPEVSARLNQGGAQSSGFDKPEPGWVSISEILHREVSPAPRRDSMPVLAFMPPVAKHHSEGLKRKRCSAPTL
jgi:hypothetical protein